MFINYVNEEYSYTILTKKTVTETLEEAMYMLEAFRALDNDDYKNYQAMDEEAKRRGMMENNNAGIAQNNNGVGVGGGNEIDQLTQQVQVINANKKVIKKTVEITTKITYTYEDGSTKEINEVKSHVFNA